MIEQSFWNNRRVLVTGHTGFKGAWLTLWLNLLGAKVFGYALAPQVESLFVQANLSEQVSSHIEDIRNYPLVAACVKECQPEIVIHMAAQALVRESYVRPLETYEVNVMGTANILEACRHVDSVRAVVVVTTDKCYENREWVWGYRETDRLGGFDPYSNSKACAELVVSAYRNSFFSGKTPSPKQAVIATARAGNVVGGGDWAKDRLIPDCMRAALKNQTVVVRNPAATRPWQHVLDPLCGYMMLAEKLYAGENPCGSAYNFGPAFSGAKPVSWIVKTMKDLWGSDFSFELKEDENAPHEATALVLDSAKAKAELNWCTKWGLKQTLAKTIEWYKSFQNGHNVRETAISQIQEYMGHDQHQGFVVGSFNSLQSFHFN